MSLFGATNLGASLFFDRKKVEITFLENKTDLGFITGDQPIVNLLATRDGSPPEELAFYYPLAPDLAIILSPREFKLKPINCEMFEELNDLIAWKSKHFVISNTVTMLQKYIADQDRLAHQSPQFF